MNCDRARSCREPTRRGTLVEDLKQHYRNTESRDLVEVNKRLKHLDAFFAGTRAAKIDASMIGRYIEQRKAEQGANGTINRELGVLTRMFRLGLENRRVTAHGHVFGHDREGLR